jgi:hypothetical protein
MENVYILVKFMLNDGIEAADWKKMSDGINEQLS